MAKSFAIRALLYIWVKVDQVHRVRSPTTLQITPGKAGEHAIRIGQGSGRDICQVVLRRHVTQCKPNIKAQRQVENRFDDPRKIRTLTALILPCSYKGETVCVRVHSVVKLGWCCRGEGVVKVESLLNNNCLGK